MDVPIPDDDNPSTLAFLAKRLLDMPESEGLVFVTSSRKKWERVGLKAIGSSSVLTNRGALIKGCVLQVKKLRE